MNVECKSAVQADPGDFLTALDVSLWIEDIPHDARIAHIVVDRGNQRDPWPVLVGLRAEWTETR